MGRFKTKELFRDDLRITHCQKNLVIRFGRQVIQGNEKNGKIKPFQGMNDNV